MNIKEIKGTAFKKGLGAERCYFRYHNKNSNGGNFGFEVRGLEGNDLEINGDYAKDGTLRRLYFGKVFWPRPISETYWKDLETLLDFIKKSVQRKEEIA